ncbi:MAG: DMT family transporter [Sediminibacterium sp.]|jgi:drug/metabolite transporter (DMT)-like permease|nr:MAG: DMT family transporter [Sediminibacterium sp.]
MDKKLINVAIFCILSIIWGSSFVLMKEGLTALSAYQVASLRMLFSGLVLLPFAINAFKKIPKEKMGIVFLSGFLGNFIPAYLFCIAETNIDSSLAGILNSLTPLFTILVGLSFFKTTINKQKMIGVMIGFIGLCLLFAAGKNISFQNLGFASLVLVATFFYGLNVNVVGKFLKNIRAIDIVSVAFAFLIIPSIIILYLTGYFSMSFNNPHFQQATMASIVLGVVGTSIASILFYMLIKRSTIIFASMVTYGIPIIAVAWGVYFGESISILQMGSLLIILAGVYIVNKPQQS